MCKNKVYKLININGVKIYRKHIIPKFKVVEILGGILNKNNL